MRRMTEYDHATKSYKVTKQTTFLLLALLVCAFFFSTPDYAKETGNAVNTISQVLEKRLLLHEMGQLIGDIEPKQRYGAIEGYYFSPEEKTISYFAMVNASQQVVAIRTLHGFERRNGVSYEYIREIVTNAVTKRLGINPRTIERGLKKWDIRTENGIRYTITLGINRQFRSPFSERIEVGLSGASE